MKLIAFVVAALCIVSSQAICPNKCSGHGSCGSSDKCTCEPGFTNPDCSGRQCAFGLSWIPASKSDSNTVPMGGMGGLHEYSECSSKGTCDRATGVCNCVAGYTGKGCRRQSCPGETEECSGHGLCQYADANSEYSASGGNQFTSEKWDGRKTRLCKCDRGWEGIDCNSRICPKGDDPLTACENSDHGNQIQKITVRSKESNFGPNGFIALKFTDMYGGVYTTKSISLNARYYPNSDITNAAGDACNHRAADDVVQNQPCYDSTTNKHSPTINPNVQYTHAAGNTFYDADAIREALEALPNFAIPSVNVTEQIDILSYQYSDDTADRFYYTSHSAADCDDGSANCGESIFYVTFSDQGTSGRQNLLECLVHEDYGQTYGRKDNSRDCSAAQPRLSKVMTSNNDLHSISCTVEEVVFEEYEEHSECSERGICDSSTGICECYEGHSGEDCSTQTIFF